MSSFATWKKHWWLVLGILLSLDGKSANADTWQGPPGHTQIALWPNEAPEGETPPGPEYVKVYQGKDDLIAGKPVTEVGNVSRPTVTVYSPEENKNTGAAIVVFPGGGYQNLAMDLEGTEVCDWLTSNGVTCLLLKYRVPHSGPYWDPIRKKEIDPKTPMALQDAQRALGLARLHASEWQLNPHRIGVLGFSAGGHLVANLSTHFGKRAYPAVDSADKESCRPDFAVALYPGHLREHTTKPFELNPLIPVTDKTPPTFIVQAEDDPVDSVQNSLVYYIALRKVGAPVEMHLYAHGGHAFGLRPTTLPITWWPRLAEEWTKTLGMITR